VYSVFTWARGGSRGPGARAPYFWQSFIFYIVYNVWKNIFEIEFLFYSCRNPRSFWKCGGVCVCVCLCDPIGLHDKLVVFYQISVGFEIVAATVFCSAKAQFWMISEAILIPKIYTRLQEIASNFSSPQAPRRRSHLRRSVRGLAPLLGPPFQNS